MQLLLYVAAFMLWEASVSLSPSATLVASYLGWGSLQRGPGYRLRSPWPGDLGLVLEAAASEHAFSLAGFRSALEAARRETRLLRVACQLYLLFLFAAMPVAIAWLGAEAAWLRALPLIGALHVGTLAALYATERRAAPRFERRSERWVGSALFPPALLRTPAELVAQRLAGFHPATAAAAVLAQPAWVQSLRMQIGRHAADGETVESLLSLCEQAGIDRRRVLAPARVDPGAASYCPRCLDEFLVARGDCQGCGVDSVAYAGGPPT